MSGQEVNDLTKELKQQMVLDHPHIVKLYNIVSDHSRMYLLYEPTMQEDLSQVLR